MEQEIRRNSLETARLGTFLDVSSLETPSSKWYDEQYECNCFPHIVCKVNQNIDKFDSKMVRYAHLNGFSAYVKGERVVLLNIDINTDMLSMLMKNR
jgi:hypothetical protein